MLKPRFWFAKKQEGYYLKSRASMQVFLTLMWLSLQSLKSWLWVQIETKVHMLEHKIQKSQIIILQNILNLSSHCNSQSPQNILNTALALFILEPTNFTCQLTRYHLGDHMCFPTTPLYQKVDMLFIIAIYEPAKY